MAVSKDELKEALNKMPVMELVELISELEEQWGRFRRRARGDRRRPRRR